MNPNHNAIQWKYIFQEMVLILVTSYLFIFASTHNGIVNLTVLTISAVLFSILVFTLIFFKRGNSSPLDKPVMGFLIVILITCFTSIDPRRSLIEFGLVCAAFFLFLYTVNLIRHNWPAELIIKVLLIDGAIIMAFAWLEVGQWLMNWYAAHTGWFPDITFRLSVPNFFGVLLNVLLMMALARLVTSRDWASRVFLGVWCLSALGLIFFSSSRGGWLGTAAGIGVFLLMMVISNKTKLIDYGQKMLQHKRISGLILLMILLVLLGVGMVFYKQAVHPTHDPIFNSRSYLWAPAWNAFLRSPWVGEGPYTFISQFMQYNSVPPGMIFVYAHSIFLDLLSGSGLFGFLCFIWLAWRVIQLLVRHFRSMKFIDSGVVMGALAALTAFGVHGLVDSVHHTIPTSAWVMAIIMGAAVGDATRLEKNEKKWGAVLPIVGIVLAGLYWGNIWLAGPFQAGVDAANMGQWQKSAEMLRMAVLRDPHMAAASQQFGLVQSVIADRNPAALSEAKEIFQKTVELDPYFSINHANLGALLMADGDINSAVREFEIAVRLAPSSWLCQINYASALEEGGKMDEAAAAYQKSLDLMPIEMRSAYFWRASGLRNRALTEWQQSHPANDVLDLMALQKAAAEAAIAEHHLRLAEAYLDLGKVEDAKTALEGAELTVMSYADHLESNWLKAEVAANQNNFTLAVQLAEDALNGYRQQGIYGPGSAGTLNYAQLMFRRPAVQIEIVPQLRLIPLPDRWGNRMKKLENWYDILGDKQRALVIADELKEKIPDFDDK